MSNMKGLKHFISDLKNATTPEQEGTRVFEELAKIRGKFRGSKVRAHSAAPRRGRRPLPLLLRSTVAPAPPRRCPALCCGCGGCGRCCHCGLGCCRGAGCCRRRWC